MKLMRYGALGREQPGIVDAEGNIRSFPVGWRTGGHWANANLSGGTRRARRLAQQLKCEGWEVGRLHVKSLMRRMGIAALYRRPRTSIPARGASIYPYCWKTWRLSGPGGSGPATSPTYRCLKVSCTWWPS